MTKRQLQQVAVTYLARPTKVGWFVAVLAAVTALMILPTAFHSEARTKLIILLCPALLLGTFQLIWLEDQLKWQFANPRAALIPGYAEPHLTAWIALACAFNLALPWGIAMLSGVSGLFMVALCLAVHACFSLAPNGFAFLAPAALLLINAKLYPETIDAWLQAEGYRGLALLATAIACAGVIGRRTMRIVRIDEEDRLYELPVWSLTDKRSAPLFRKAKAAAGGAHHNFSHEDGTATRLDQAISNSRRWPAWRRLRLAMDDERRSWRDALGTFAYIAVVLAVIQWQRSGRWSFGGETWSVGMQFLPLATLFAGLIPAANLANRIPQMQIERLLPMSNQAYADAILATAAETSLKSWAGVHVLVAVLTYALPWENADIPTAGRAATYLLLSAAGLFVTFGAAARFSVFSGVFGAFVAVIVGSCSTLWLAWYWYGLLPHEGNGVAPFWAVVCVIAGGFLIARARTAWREKELG